MAFLLSLCLPFYFCPQNEKRDSRCWPPVISLLQPARTTRPCFATYGAPSAPPSRYAILKYSAHAFLTFAAEPLQLLRREKGALAHALIMHALGSLPIRRFFNNLISEMMEEADTLDLHHPHSCFDAAKSFFRKFGDLADSAYVLAGAPILSKRTCTNICSTF